jgi:hypothetical protein
MDDDLQQHQSLFVRMLLWGRGKTLSDTLDDVVRETSTEHPQ